MDNTAFQRQVQCRLALYGENPTPEIIVQVLREVTQERIDKIHRGRDAATRATKEDCVHVLRVDLDKAHARIMELERSSRIAIVQLEGQLEAELETNAALRARLADCEAHREECEQDFSHMQAARDELHMQVSEQEKHRQSLETQLELCQRQLADTVSARDESHARAQKSEEEVSRLTHQVEVFVQEHQDSISQLEAELEGTRSQCRQLQSELSLPGNTCSHSPVKKGRSAKECGASTFPVLNFEERPYPVLLEPEAALAAEYVHSQREMEIPQYFTPTNQEDTREETSTHLPRGPAESVSACPESVASSWSPEEMHPLGIAVGWAYFACLGGGHLQKQKLWAVNTNWVRVLGQDKYPGGKAGLSVFLRDSVHLWRGTDWYFVHGFSISAAVELLLVDHWTRGATCLLPRDYGIPFCDPQRHQGCFSVSTLNC